MDAALIYVWLAYAVLTEDAVGVVMAVLLSLHALLPPNYLDLWLTGRREVLQAPLSRGRRGK